MSVNAFIPQGAASNAGLFSEYVGSPARPAQRSTEFGSRKNFAAVLQTISRERETTPSQKSGDRQPLNAPERTERMDRTKTPADRSSRYQTSEVQRDKTEETRCSGLDTSGRADAPGTDLESQESQARTSESRSSQHQQESESGKGTAEEGSHPGSAASDAADASKEGLDLRPLGGDAHADSESESPVAVPSLPEVLIPAPSMGQPVVAEPGSGEGSAPSGAEHREESVLNPTPVGLTFVAATGLLPSQAASRDLLVPESRSTPATNHEGPSEDMQGVVADTVSQAHEDAGHGVRSGLGDVEQKTTGSHGDARSVSLPSGLSPLSQQADLDRTIPGSLASPVPEKTPSPRASESVRPPQAIPLEQPASVAAQTNVPFPSQTDSHETKPLSALPPDRHAVADGALRSGLDWSEQGGREHAGNESPLAHHMAAAPTPLGLASEAVGEVGFAGTAALSMSRPVESSAVSNPAPAPPVPASRDIGESPVSVTTRSVVFEVAQADLGHINIRVAMANEVVHTYLSSDSAEVGQFLISGQDRLQTALQANGLEMGQFRVNIDRQGASSGGQEWLGREYGDRSSQQQDNHRQQDRPQDQPTGFSRADRQRLSGLSVFA
jgi:hypothetical protein